MWKQFKLENISGEFKYRTDHNTFFLSCFSPSTHLSGEKLYIRSCRDNTTPMCLGSFSPAEKGVCLEKTYPISFFKINGIVIDKETDFSFSLKQGDGNPSSNAVSSDPAIMRAIDLAENHPQSSDGEKIVIEIRNDIEEKLSSFPIASLHFLPEYTFHIIDNIKHPFKLSAIDHIVHSSEFVSAFVKSGEWYLGEKKESNIIVLCIATGKDDINPMYNASDCDTIYESDNVFYHTVGIELCFDGQYFCTVQID